MKILMCLLVFVGLRCEADEVLRLKGSDTLGAKLVPQWAESHKADHPGTKFEIAAEGSSTAFPALLDGTADIGMSSRDIKPEEAKRFEEKGIAIERHIVAYDVLVIVVNASNPVTGLTRKQVEGLFTGDIANWKDIGGADMPVKVTTRNTSSGTYKDFQTLAMSGRPYGHTANRMAGSEHPTQIIAKEQGGSPVSESPTPEPPASRRFPLMASRPLPPISPPIHTCVPVTFSSARTLRKTSAPLSGSPARKRARGSPPGLGFS